MSDSKLIRALELIIGVPPDALSVIEGRVLSIEKSDRTCAVLSIGGDSDIEIPGVRLQSEVSDGILILPRVDSTVFVGYSKRLAPFVLQFGDVDYVVMEAGGSTFELSSDGKIRINDGSYGGLTKTRDLVAELNKTNLLLNSLLTVINGFPIPEPGSGAPSALQTALKSAIAGKTLGSFAAIENTQVTHGK